MTIPLTFVFSPLLSPINFVRTKTYRLHSNSLSNLRSGLHQPYDNRNLPKHHTSKHVSLTPLTPICFRGHTIHVKRDDLLSFQNIIGSKFRKFYSLCSPDALLNYDAVISFGGAQSNAMLALARLCYYHKTPFIYITRTISKRIVSIPGNFQKALEVGMIHVELDNQLFTETFTDSPASKTEPKLYNILAAQNNPKLLFNSFLFIPQGGAWSGSEEGVQLLAKELLTQVTDLRKNGTISTKKPILFLPSGTGTTALYLQKHLGESIKVVTVPVSGDERYLVKQMRWLNMTTESNSLATPSIFPDVLHPRLRGSFADIRPEKLAIWRELTRAAGFDFDLIYAPKAWEEIALALFERRIARNGEDLLYYHTGGVEGNVSMLGKRLCAIKLYVEVLRLGLQHPP